MLTLGLLGTVGLGGATYAQTARRKPVIALVMKSLNKEFPRAIRDGAKDYQAHNADQFDLLTDGITGDADATAEIGIVRAMIGLQVNAIVLAPVDSQALVPVVTTAIGARIIVITIDNELDDAWLRGYGINVPFVGPDDRKGAKLVGNYVATRLTPGDEVGIIGGPPNEANSQRRTAGFIDALRAHGVTAISVRSGQWQTAPAQAVAADMLRQHPRIKALLCGNDPMAIGAVMAIQAAQLSGKVYVSGYDNIAPIKSMLRDGSVLATADHFPAKQGVFGVDLALKAVAERKKQADLPRFFETPVQLITK
jgi:ribose transport system substrate-binding protein